MPVDNEFRETAPSAPAVFFRSYSRRKPDGQRESFREAITRTVTDLAEIGSLRPEQKELALEMGLKQHAFPSGRALWVAGTEWAKQPENFSGYYNCHGAVLTDLKVFGRLMNLAMCGTGTGVLIEKELVEKLPVVRNRIEILEVLPLGESGGTPHTDLFDQGDHAWLQVGDSRQGWVDAYQGIINAAFSKEEFPENTIKMVLDLGQVRPAGHKLKGFGGTANPVALEQTLRRVVNLLNKAQGRRLTAVECCLLVDEAAACVVAGNIRRCLPEDALVHTYKGLVAIKDIAVGDMVQTPIGFRRVTNKFDQGVQDVYELDTNGPHPRATLNHRIARLADARGGIDWVQVGDLQQGDRLMHSTDILPGEQTSLPADFTVSRPKNSHTAKEIKIPLLNTDVAWLIGFTHGDGYVALGRNKHDKPFGFVSWATNSLKEAESLAINEKINQGLAHFNVQGARSLVKGENTAKTVCSSIRLAEYFYAHIKKPNQALEVPNFILRGTADVRAAYLAGVMDSDGAVNNRPPHLVTTVYPTFARQIAVVASSLGIACRTSVVTPQEQGHRIKHNVTMPALKGRYNSLVAPYSVKGKIKEGQKTYGFTLPGKIMREAYSYTEMTHMGFVGTRTVDANYERYTAESGSDIDIPVTFKGLSSYNSIQTYDIEVEEAHCFYCDGYLTHNSAGIRLFSNDDEEAKVAKLGLYTQDDKGNWRVDPEREALRLANHTICYHHKPTYEEIFDAVSKQYYSGEGAIQYSPEAIARCNADLLDTPTKKQEFLDIYTAQGREAGREYLRAQGELLGRQESEALLDHRIYRYSANPCHEINGNNFQCNLGEVHLNTIDPKDKETQHKAFYSTGLLTSTLLQHKFTDPQLQFSREVDPIVAVCLSGLFDFFVHALGIDWVRWMIAGRPDNAQGRKFCKKEVQYLESWKESARQGVYDYCTQAGIKMPNRYTAVQPSGSKALLTGASSGWHPPKAAWFIRRITFGVNDPLVSALRDWGYNVVPAQSARDELGNLLDDISDPRVSEVLVEIPTKVSWADLPGAEECDLSQIPATSQMELYMQVQRYYSTHTTSATVEFRENEIEDLAKSIHTQIQEDRGYIGVALLARFDDSATFPRLPFEPITKEEYERLQDNVHSWRIPEDENLGFLAVLNRYDNPDYQLVPEAACTSAACIAKADDDERQGKPQ